MKRKKKIENDKVRGAKKLQPTCFEMMANLQCEMHRQLRLSPPQYPEKTNESPAWAKNICQNFGKTIFKSIRKLRPNGAVNWRNYGRIIGICDRYLTFFKIDAPRMLKEDGLDKIGKERWKRMEARLGVNLAREHYLKILGPPADHEIPNQILFELVFENQIAHLEKIKQNAFAQVSEQSAKNNALFKRGVGEGYILFLNENAEFSGDDRRAGIHLELLAMQNDIEKMRKSVLPKTNQHLIGELKKLPEFKNRTQDWFKDVFKDIKLSIGRPGRPPKYLQA
jgi:hypothetical protein